MKVIAGIDYSMSSPAICIYDTSKEFKFENLLFFSLYDGAKRTHGVHGNIEISGHQKWECSEQRYRQIADWAVNILIKHKVQEVTLEGYAMGASSGLVFNIAENTSVLKQKLYDLGLKYTAPAPSAVKKNFTGKGNANKQAMCEEFYKRFGVKPHEIFNGKQYDSPENDIVDSVANLCMHPDMKG